MGIGGSIAYLSNRPEDSIVTDWANRVTAIGDIVPEIARKAYSNFVYRLKIDGLWQKMNTGIIMPFASNTWTGAIVPLVAPPGSTFTSVLMSFSDYSFFGGVDPGAANVDPKRIETNINAQAIFGVESAQVSVYRPIHRLGRDSVANTLNGDDLSNRLQFHCNWENGSTEFDAFNFNTAFGRVSVSGVNPVGLMTGLRLNNQVKLFKNAFELGVSNVSSSPVPNATINLLGCFISNYSFYSRSSATYLYLGQALTNAEELVHYNHVQRLQVELGRSM
jgi:hypothetical protein